MDVVTKNKNPIIILNLFIQYYPMKKTQDSCQIIKFKLYANGKNKQKAKMILSRTFLIKLAMESPNAIKIIPRTLLK